MNDVLPVAEPFDDGAPEAAYARFPRRLVALVSDAALVTGGFAVLFLAAAATGAETIVRVLLAAFVLVALLYDPVLVSRTGGTLGHRWTNLRVVDDDTGGNLPFGRALARSLIKTVLGLPSFVFIGLTRRYQALHDLASRSTVQVRDVSRARPYHYVYERADTPEPLNVSRRRRVLVILAYAFAIYIVISVISIVWVDDRCLLENVCTPGDNLAVSVITAGWLGATAWAVVRGWRGRLPGCRPRSPLSF
jgi:uncharacterized RDD family membrane protein YckC